MCEGGYPARPASAMRHVRVGTCGQYESSSGGSSSSQNRNSIREKGQMSM